MNSSKQRALALLGQGHAQSVVASALGVSESYISQLLSDEDFAAQVQECRVQSLSAATDIDNKYNKIEMELLNKLEGVAKLFVSPRDILNALTKINAAKRRGAAAAPETVPRERIVVLELPQKVQYNFVTNINQQVVEIQEDGTENSQSLVTIPINELGKIANENAAEHKKSLSFSGRETGADSEESDTGSVRKKSSLAEML